MADKKIRVRKPPVSSSQTDAAGIKTENNPSLKKISGSTTGLSKPTLLSSLRPLLRPFRWLVPRYFINSWRELRQVIWPNRRETWRLTLAVFIFAIVFGALVAGVDKSLDLLFKKVILKQ